MPDDADGNPLCDVWGDCEPHPDERHHTQAMCWHCGGWRYRDYPQDGNWGQWDSALEKTWVHRDKIVDTDRQA